MPARRQEGVPAIPTAKERDFRQGCITPPVRGSIWLRCGSLWRCSPAFAAAFPVASSVCTSFNPDRPVAFLPVCPRAGRQAQGQAGMQAEGQGCQPDGRKACRPFRPQRKGTFAELMSLCPCVAAFGAGPGSVLLLGSRRVSGDRYPVKSGMTGLPQSVCYGFLCPLRHSKVSFELLKGFRVTPETTLPLAGRGFLSEVGKPVFLPAVRLPEAALRP